MNEIDHLCIYKTGKHMYNGLYLAYEDVKEA
jgi:hypothetical protein